MLIHRLAISCKNTYIQFLSIVSMSIVQSYRFHVELIWCNGTFMEDIITRKIFLTLNRCTCAFSFQNVLLLCCSKIEKKVCSFFYFKQLKDVFPRIFLNQSAVEANKKGTLKYLNKNPFKNLENHKNLQNVEIISGRNSF